MVHVYILKSLKDNGYYIGITGKLGERLSKHNNGKVYSTKNRKPFVIIWSEPYRNYSEARKKEKELKLYKGGNKLKKLIGA